MNTTKKIGSTQLNSILYWNNGERCVFNFAVRCIVFFGYVCAVVEQRCSGKKKGECVSTKVQVCTLSVSSSRKNMRDGEVGLLEESNFRQVFAKNRIRLLPLPLLSGLIGDFTMGELIQSHIFRRSCCFSKPNKCSIIFPAGFAFHQHVRTGASANECSPFE